MNIGRATITDSEGNKVKVSRSSDSITFDAEEGETYTITFDGKGGISSVAVIIIAVAATVVVAAAVIIIVVSSRRIKRRKNA